MTGLVLMRGNLKRVAEPAFSSSDPEQFSPVSAPTNAFAAIERSNRSIEKALAHSAGVLNAHRAEKALNATLDLQKRAKPLIA